MRESFGNHKYGGADIGLADHANHFGDQLCATLTLYLPQSDVSRIRYDRLNWCQISCVGNKVAGKMDNLAGDELHLMPL
jgi:hypothetical protein